MFRLVMHELLNPNKFSTNSLKIKYFRKQGTSIKINNQIFFEEIGICSLKTYVLCKIELQYVLKGTSHS
jgi:hypothetical protein